MRFVLEDLESDVQQTARRFLAAEMPLERTRAALGIGTRSPGAVDMDQAVAWQRAAWQSMATQGWLEMTAPDQAVLAGLISEEIGRQLAPLPYVSTTFAVVPLLSQAEKAVQLREVLAGEQLLALAFTDRHCDGQAAHVPLTAREHRGGYLIDGSVEYVAAPGWSDGWIAAARTGADPGWDGLSLFLLPEGQSGLSWHQQRSADLTRPTARLDMNDVFLPTEALVGEPGEGGSWLGALLPGLTAALCAEMVGGAQRLLDLATAYALERRQFDKPIGSFQAVQHRLVDMLVAVESMRSAAYFVLGSIEGDADAGEQTSSREMDAAVAKAYCSRAYRETAENAIQIHGGLGFTWEHDAHLYYRRALVDAQLLGGTAYHEERITAAMRRQRPD